MRTGLDRLATHSKLGAQLRTSRVGLLAHPASVDRRLRHVRHVLEDLGVKIAIDNFGSEYSSFDYIRAYRINHLKIAQSFVNRSCTEAASAATISAIIGFARDVGVGVIAQGVETEEQRALLSATDSTTQAQGFHFSKAVGAAEAGELLRRGRIETAVDDPLEERAA